MRNAVIIQRYVPAYRVPLFAELAQLLADDGIGFAVVHSAPHGQVQRRSDATTGGAWQVAAGSWSIRLRGRSLGYVRVGNLVDRDTAVIVELSISSMNMWTALARRRSRTILWGHGRMYVKKSHWLTDRIRVGACRLAAHTMTYSEGGRQWLVNHGVPSSRVTSIGNSTDTARLMRARAASEETAPLLREEHDAYGPTALYVGGLDRDKRIPFLLLAAEAAHQIDPSFRLLLAGAGEQEHLVARCNGAPWLRWLRRVTPQQFAALSWVADSIWMPGRVGLVAVDAMALGLPVLTTPFPFHAPELEFLTPNKSLHVLSDDPAQFARSALSMQSASVPTSASETVPSVAAVAEAARRIIKRVLADSAHA